MYRCKCCGRTLVPLVEIPDVQTGFDNDSFVCIECDYIIGEDEIIAGIEGDPNFDIEEAKDDCVC